MRRVIVCGGRDFDDFNVLEQALDRHVRDDDVIVHGGATGADDMADTYAGVHQIAMEVFPADWKTYGRAAGPIRNRQMLAAGADLVIAFPGGRGTGHMVATARDLGVPVLEVTP